MFWTEPTVPVYWLLYLTLQSACAVTVGHGSRQGKVESVDSISESCDSWMKILAYYQSESFLTLSIICFYLKHFPLFVYNNVSETGLCLRLQVKPTQLGPIDRVSPYRPYLQTPVPTPDKIYKPSTAQPMSES
jgi:hypothetical protein